MRPYISDSALASFPTPGWLRLHTSGHASAELRTCHLQWKRQYKRQTSSLENLERLKLLTAIFGY